jgi:hypothetical protein
MELGSVADWFAGIGSIGVGVAALVLAIAEKRRGDRAEAENVRARQTQNNAVIVAALRIVHGLGINARAHVAKGMDVTNGDIVAISEDLVEAKQSALRLLAMPMITAELFGSLDRIARLETIKPDIHGRMGPLMRLSEVSDALGAIERDLRELLARHPEPLQTSLSAG